MKLLLTLPLIYISSCGQAIPPSYLKEPMDARNDPVNLPSAASTLEYKASELPDTGSVERIWWGSWYPLAQGGTAVRYYHNIPSTMEKYDTAAGTNGAATKWELESVKAYANVGWAGHCNGLAAASVMVEEPKKSVVYKNVNFTIEDIKALLVESWQGSGYIIGDRCDQKQITFDSYGRIQQTECRDVNPATFHLAVTNYLGLFGKAIIADVDNSAAVWNYVIDSYQIQDKKWLSQSEAAMKVQGTSSYVFNSEATDFVHIKMTVNYAHFSSRTYEYILELNQKGKIVGGEWVGSNKREHPDFIWRPSEPKLENPNLDLNIINTIYKQSI
jgi:hypothetical protein